MIHELGHTFGWFIRMYTGIHASQWIEHGFNHKNVGRGLNPAMFGQFNPEEFYTLAQNKRVFPDFSYVPAVHNPNGRKFHPFISAA